MLNAKCYFFPFAIFWLGLNFQLCCRRFVCQFVQLALYTGRYAIDIRSFSCWLCLGCSLAEHGPYQRGDSVAHIAPGLLWYAPKDHILMSILLHHAMHAAPQAIRIGIGAQLNGAARPVEGIGKATALE